MAVRTLSRRTLLRGGAGVAIALPLLDAMLDGNGEALAQGMPLPKRYLVSFGGFSLRTDKDGSTDGVVPNVVGPNYDLKIALQPLSLFNQVQRDVTVVSGLSVPMNAGGTVPAPGGGLGFHHHMPCLWTGHRSIGTDFVRPIFHGSSSDQLVADAIGGSTRFASLGYKVQASDYVVHPTSGQPPPAFMRHLSWRKQGQGDAAPVPAVTSPRQAFETLFTGFTPTDPSLAAKQARELLRRKSVLDLVDRRMSGLRHTLGAADQRRIDAHLVSIRQLEALIASAPPPPMAQSACVLPMHPGNDPAIGASQLGDAPMSYMVNAGWSDEKARARIFTDLLHMAFTCDLTRAAALMYSHVQSAMNCFPISGYRFVFHSLHHHGGTTSQLNSMIAWHVEQFGALVAKLRDTPEGAGRLLDNCALCFMCEGGNGNVAGNDPTEFSHCTDGMVMLVAGRAGGLRAGEHIVAPAGRRHPANVLLTMMNAVGAGTAQLGDVSGTLPELLS